DSSCQRRLEPGRWSSIGRNEPARPGRCRVSPGARMNGSAALPRSVINSRRREGLVRASGAVLAALGALVTIGWVLDLPTLKGIAPNFATMKVNEALAFLLAGGALMLRPSAGSAEQRATLAGAAGLLAAALAGVIALLTVWEYAADIDLGIDELLI